MSEQRNLILAVVLSVAIVIAFDFFYRGPATKKAPAPEPAKITQTAPQQAPARPQGEAPVAVPGSPAATPPAVPGAPTAAAAASRAKSIAEGRRLRIATPRLHGSVLLDGGRIDDITLANYRETIDRNSPEIVLLSPTGAEHPYYAEFGWLPAHGTNAKVPGRDTPWRSDVEVLAPGRPATLSWDNGAGLLFKLVLELDDNYLMRVTQVVENSGKSPAQLYAYGLISRTDTPNVTGFYILHEGPLGVFNGTLEERKYTDVKESDKSEWKSTGGWIGITDKYWLTALIPAQNEPFTASLHHSLIDERDKYQVDVLRNAVEVAPGQSASATSHLFAGAKLVKLLNRYDRTLSRGAECQSALGEIMPGARAGCLRFDLAIDWGWFYFLTKPIFFVLDYFNGLIGNFGLAILLLTVLIKLLFFPLANKSYRAMSKIKALQPEMEKLRQRLGDDKQRLQQEMMGLYKREKVNPMSGCLPMVIQIPVFFALYKVLFVTIEMRHAPFYGWIADLSAHDPTNLLTLFGMIPGRRPSSFPRSASGR